MSYAQRKQMSSNRTVAIIIVALLHVVLGYALVTGLAYNVMKKAAEDLKTFDVEEEPPPPEELPPPPPDQPDLPPPPSIPPPIVRTNLPPPPIVLPQAPINPMPAPIIRAPPAPPAPPAPRTVQPAKAKANLASYVSNDDYPQDAIRNGEAGTTGFTLQVGANGRVTNCSVTASSGSRSLDNTTCRLMTSRARFTPATDNYGKPTSDSASGRIRWVLPDE
ncbi:MAG: energy transducer TonB [Sphingomicrobium sp.]